MLRPVPSSPYVIMNDVSVKYSPYACHCVDDEYKGLRTFVCFNVYSESKLHRTIKCVVSTYKHTCMPELLVKN